MIKLSEQALQTVTDFAKCEDANGMPEHMMLLKAYKQGHVEIERLREALYKTDGSCQYMHLYDETLYGKD